MPEPFRSPLSTDKLVPGGKVIYSIDSELLCTRVDMNGHFCGGRLKEKLGLCLARGCWGDEGIVFLSQ